MIYQDRVIHVASWAARFLFDPEDLNQPVGRLSGGERARVLIAQLMLQPADVLLLDEPTNDLDIPTLEILEESLLEYRGALVLVTHDRYMLDRVSTIVLGLDGLGGAERFADYSQWDAWQRSQQKGTAICPAARGAPAGGERSDRQPRKRSFPIMRFANWKRLKSASPKPTKIRGRRAPLWKIPRSPAILRCSEDHMHRDGRGAKYFGPAVRALGRTGKKEERPLRRLVSARLQAGIVSRGPMPALKAGATCSVAPDQGRPIQH